MTDILVAIVFAGFAFAPLLFGIGVVYAGRAIGADTHRRTVKAWAANEASLVVVDGEVDEGTDVALALAESRADERPAVRSLRLTSIHGVLKADDVRVGRGTDMNITRGRARGDISTGTPCIDELVSIGGENPAAVVDVVRDERIQQALVRLFGDAAPEAHLHGTCRRVSVDAGTLTVVVRGVSNPRHKGTLPLTVAGAELWLLAVRRFVIALHDTRDDSVVDESVAVAALGSASGSPIGIGR